MLKRILVLSMMIISMPSFATDVTGGETCDTDVLNTDTGPVNLRAEFEPEVINLKWYNDGNQITVPTASNSCTYDTPISLPANPVKPGYKFKGWKVRLEYDFSTIDASIIADDQYAKNGQGQCYSGYIFTSSFCTSSFSDLNNNEWKVIYSHGTLYGESLVKDGNCYCRATGYIPAGSTIKYAPTHPTGWIYQRPDDGLCTIHCCPLYDEVWRKEVLGQQ